MNIIELEISSNTKEELLQELANALQLKYGVSAETVLRDYQARELEYSTGLENGFAIPHCRTDVNEVYVILGNVVNHIEGYSTFDGSQVENIISFVVPNDPSGEKEHLKMLSTVMRSLVNVEVQDAYKKANSLDEKIKILGIGE